jgi:Zn-dependent M28 family amino/carboxypeptidase
MFCSTRAPGGDDDGSGTIHLLAIARAIYRKKVKFDIDVELVAFAGEEQGLLGSHAYASKGISSYKDKASYFKRATLRRWGGYHADDTS